MILLHHKGLKRQEIAKATGYGITRISQIINTQPGRDYLDELRSIEEEVVAGEVGQRVSNRLEGQAVAGAAAHSVPL